MEKLIKKKETPESYKESQLDGCYVIKTDVPVSFLGATSNEIHDRFDILTLLLIRSDLFLFYLS